MCACVHACDRVHVRVRRGARVLDMRVNEVRVSGIRVYGNARACVCVRVRAGEGARV